MTSNELRSRRGWIGPKERWRHRLSEEDYVLQKDYVLKDDPRGILVPFNYATRPSARATDRDTLPSDSI